MLQYLATEYICPDIWCGHYSDLGSRHWDKPHLTYKILCQLTKGQDVFLGDSCRLTLQVLLFHLAPLIQIS